MVMLTASFAVVVMAHAEHHERHHEEAQEEKQQEGADADKLADNQQYDKAEEHPENMAFYIHFHR
jgi:hypothetical protein